MAYRKLGVTNKHRRSMLASLTKQLIINERIETTETRAKEVRKCFDKMVTYGKSGSLVSRRLAAIRQTLNRIPSSIKGTDTFCFINPVFYVVF